MSKEPFTDDEDEEDSGYIPAALHENLSGDEEPFELEGMDLEKAYLSSADPFDEVDLPEGVVDSMLRFHFLREEDESGVSGTGVVASGVYFWDGSVAIKWLNDREEGPDTNRNGWAIYEGPDGLEDAKKVHGHGGKTEIVFEDRPSEHDRL